MKRHSVIFGYFDEGWWMAEAITKDGSRPLNRRETMRFVIFYLREGKGSFMKRLSSVMKRLFAASLKPTQLSFEKRGTHTSP